MKHKLIFLILTCILIISCNKKKLNAGDYMRYIENEENGLKVTKNIDDVNYNIQYKPASYVLLKENRNSNSKPEEIDGMQYYTLSLSLKNSNKDILRYNLHEQNEYYERVNYLSYGLSDDIFLVEGTDTLKCNLFNYVRSYGLSTRADFILGFNKSIKNSIEDKLIILEDKVFGGGIIKLKISAEDLKNIPVLI